MVILDEFNNLAKLFEDRGFLIFDFFETIKVMSLSDFCLLPLTRRGEILIVDTQAVLSQPNKLEQFKSVSNTFLGIVFFHDHSNRKAEAWIQEQSAIFTKIIGEYSLPMPDIKWSILANQLNFFWGLREEQKALQRHMTQFSSELESLLQSTEVELSKAKKIHEVLIPKRKEEIKGIKFYSKYAAGDGGGGEFYDLEHQGNKIFQIMFSSQSYLISSTLMGIINRYKQEEFNTLGFIQECIQEINLINSSKKKKSEVDLIVLETDLNQLSMRASGWGRIELYGSKGRIEFGLGKMLGEGVEGKTYQLNKDEKLFIFSSGFLFNWKEKNLNSDIYTFLQEHKKKSMPELLMELFFQIKQKVNSDFLSKDATVVMMEVNRHGIHQV